MTHAAPAYGLWPLVLLNAAVFIIFALSFARPQSARDWRSVGALPRLAQSRSAWRARCSASAGRAAASSS